MAPRPAILCPAILCPAILCFALLLLAAEARGQAHAEAQPETWHSLEEALSIAELTRQPVVVYVHAPWCAPCRRLERDVLPRLQLDGVLKASVDLSDRPDPGFTDAAFERLRSAGLDIPPTFALLEADGKVAAAITGYQEASKLELFLSLARDQEAR